MLPLYKDLARDIDQESTGDQGQRIRNALHSSNTVSGIFNEFLAAGRISLDYEMRLFWPIGASYAATTAFFINTPSPMDPLIPHKLYPPLLYHGPTGEIPAVIHLSGTDGEEFRTNWWGLLWWNNFRDEDDRFKRIVMGRLKNGTVKFPTGDERPWWGLCPVQSLDLSISQDL
jgi:hypothetical protein